MHNNVFQAYIRSDTAFIVIMVLFGISNGYVQSICLMYGPKMLRNPTDQSRAASILVFYLVFGLMIGALLSAPILQLL